MNTTSSELTPNISIRLANYFDPPDGQAIIGLLDHYAQQAEGGGKPLARYTTNNLIAELQKLDGAISVIAFNNGKAIGLINCLKSFSSFKCKPVLNIHDLIVRGDYRKLGIAQTMLEFVEAFAKENDYCKLTLEVLSNNLAAKSLYKKVGFNAYELQPKMGQALFWEKLI